MVVGEVSTPKDGRPNDVVQREEEVLQFWKDNHCFETSLSMRPANKPYVFYDGPPFATGLPHYGHIVASLMKDMVPRFWTMRGYRVERVWGWDCHGLPLENLIEKELGIKDRHGIEDMGVQQFNDACRAAVLRYADEWKKIIPRLGRWVDMEHCYATMDRSYMESVWWVFRQLWDRQLIYEGHKSMHICPRCQTPLSNFEVTQGYAEVEDIGATVQFKVLNAQEKLGLSGDVFMLAWTTTPWTLPGNALLAVNPGLQYAVVEHNGTQYILFEGAVERVFAYREGYHVVKTVFGSDLLSLTYQPLFPYFVDTANAFRVVAGDFVTTDEGTGVVHIAPAFGEDDYAVGQREEVPLIQHVKMDGTIVDEVIDFAGMEVKPKASPQSTDARVVAWLREHGSLFESAPYHHTYPHCWRCDTPLLNYTTTSWFVRVTELRDELLSNNQQIHWVPEHMKDGRFGKWLEGVRDWAISRNRFWGAPLPIWKSEDGDVLCVGSVAELEELSGQNVSDLHKEVVDAIVIEKDGKTYRRISEVLDCWFESGAMPYGSVHYPFERKDQLASTFPAEFIAEGQDQTRGWFYTLHVLATALTHGDQPAIPGGASPAFRNVVVNGIVLAEDGRKMSKRLKNYPDPMEVVQKYGADALRFYLASSPVMEAENLNFSEKDVNEVSRKCINTLWNVYTFYRLFADQHTAPVTPITRADEATHVLDRWVMSQLHLLVQTVTHGYEQYHLRQTALPILDFVQELSTWYVRRSRSRFKGSDEADREMALRTLLTVLTTLVQVAAPVMPFITEHIYRALRRDDMPISVHHTDWPTADASFIDASVVEAMMQVRSIVEQGLALRAAAGIKVRQPLAAVVVLQQLTPAYEQIVMEELNVKDVRVGDAVSLDTTMTDELRMEGVVRELVRQTNALRKKAGLTLNNRIALRVQTSSDLVRRALEIHGTSFQQSVLASSLSVVAEPQAQEVTIDGETVTIGW